MYLIKSTIFNRILTAGTLILCTLVATNAVARPCAISHDLQSCEEAVPTDASSSYNTLETPTITVNKSKICDDYYDWSVEEAIEHGAVDSTNPQKCKSDWVCKWCSERCRDCENANKRLRAIHKCAKEYEALLTVDNFKSAKAILKEERSFDGRQAAYNNQFAKECADEDSTFEYFSNNVDVTCGKCNEEECSGTEVEWTAYYFQPAFRDPEHAPTYTSVDLKNLRPIPTGIGFGNGFSANNKANHEKVLALDCSCETLKTLGQCKCNEKAGWYATGGGSGTLHGCTYGIDNPEHTCIEEKFVITYKHDNEVRSTAGMCIHVQEAELEPDMPKVQ